MLLGSAMLEEMMDAIFEIEPYGKPMPEWIERAEKDIYDHIEDLAVDKRIEVIKHIHHQINRLLLHEQKQQWQWDDPV